MSKTAKVLCLLFLALFLSFQLLCCGITNSPSGFKAKASEDSRWQVYYEGNDESTYRFDIGKVASGFEIMLYVSTDDRYAMEHQEVFNDDWIEFTFVSSPITVTATHRQYTIEPIVGFTKIGYKGDREKSVGGVHLVYYVLPKTSFVSYVNITLHATRSTPRLNVSRSFIREWNPTVNIVQLKIRSDGWSQYNVTRDCKGRASLISFGAPVGDQPKSSSLTWCFGKMISPPKIIGRPNVYVEVGYAGGINLAPESFAGTGNYACKINVGVGWGLSFEYAIANGLQETVYMVKKGDWPEIAVDEAASGARDVMLELLQKYLETETLKNVLNKLGHALFVLDLIDVVSTLGFDETVAKSQILVFKDLPINKNFFVWFNFYAGIASAGLTGGIVNFWGECPFGHSIFDDLGFSVVNLPDGGMQIGGILFDYHEAYPPEGDVMFIREDGYISPPTPFIVSEDFRVYHLIDDIKDTLIIMRDNVVLDGGFHVVRGVDVYYDRANVTIEKLRIIGGSIGICLKNPHNVTVQHNIIAENKIGIQITVTHKPPYWVDILGPSQYSTLIYDNNFTCNSVGVKIVQINFHDDWEYSGDYIISRNNFTLNGCGISGATGSYVITENYFKDNENAVRVVGTSATISTNTIIDCDSGINGNFNLLVTCEGNYVANADTCMEIRAVYNGTISRNRLFNCKNGIVSTFGGHLNITENQVLSCDYAVLVRQGTANIMGNEIAARVCGICLPTQPHREPPSWGVSGWRIINNAVDGAEYGIYAGGNLFNGEIHACCITNCYYGIYVNKTQDLTIHENSLLGNVYGIYVTDNHNYLGKIVGNSFLHNNVTIYFKDTFYFKSWDCYHNNFLGGKVECLRHEPYYEDFWDNGYPSGGNYWSNYGGEDRKSGPEQNLEGSDGIGDVPYRINAAFVDRYPLMEPYGELRPIVYSHQLADGAVLRLTSNSAILNLICDIAAQKITFEIYWRSGTKGFAIIDIPKSIFKGEPEVYFDGKTIPFNKSEVDGSTRISFSYEHSKHYVEIRFSAGGGAPPQLSMQNYMVFIATAAGLLLIILLLILYLRKRRVIPSRAEPLPPPPPPPPPTLYPSFRSNIPIK